MQTLVKKYASFYEVNTLCLLIIVPITSCKDTTVCTKFFKEANTMSENTKEIDLLFMCSYVI